MMSAVIKFSLSLGLVILYGLGVVIWYELLRSEIMDLIARRRRRRHKAQADTAGGGGGPEQAGLAKSEHGAPERGAAEESEIDPARRHYHLAREAAKAERDAAVQAATEATKQAVDRIEQRDQRVDAVDDPVGNAAHAERDAAIDAANAATRQAVDRIERRYREIDWALEDEEAERLEALPRRR